MIALARATWVLVWLVAAAGGFGAEPRAGAADTRSVLYGACYCRAAGALHCTANLSERECRRQCDEALDQGTVESIEDGRELRRDAAPYRPDRQREVEPGDAAHAQTRAERAPGEDAGRDQPEAALTGHEGELELVGVGLDGHAQPEVGGEQGPLQERPRRAAFRIQDPARVAQARQPEGAGAPTPRLHHHETLLAEARCVQPGRQPLGIREQHDGAVEAARPYPFQQIAAPTRAEGEGDAG